MAKKRLQGISLMPGNPRATKDIDFLVSIDSENLEKLQKALLAFGSPAIDIERFKMKIRKAGWKR
jgi:hypothetical protein